MSSRPAMEPPTWRPLSSLRRPLRPPKCPADLQQHSGRRLPRRHHRLRLPRHRPRGNPALHPGPGLTLVVGPQRLGQVELRRALEVLLTGASLRWAGARRCGRTAGATCISPTRPGRRRSCWSKAPDRHGDEAVEAGGRVEAGRRGPAPRQGEAARHARLERGARHSPAVPLLQRAGLAARRGPSASSTTRSAPCSGSRSSWWCQARLADARKERQARVRRV